MTSTTERLKSQDGSGTMTRLDRFIPWMFVAFFVVVAAVNGVMIFFALHSFTGISTDDAYEKGLAYNRTLAAAQAQAKLGWQVAADFRAQDRESVQLAVTLRDKQGAAIAGAALTARFIRPTSAGADSEVTLQDVGNGRYEAQPILALPGQWDMVLTASHDSASYQTTKRVFVPQ